MSDPLDGFRGESNDPIALLHRQVRVGQQTLDLVESELGADLVNVADEVMKQAEKGVMNAAPHDVTEITKHQIEYKAANMAITWLMQSINAGKASAAQLLQQQENEHA